ncbi:MAG: hypothetical protein PVF17_05940 [Ignavibacteria bacterium]|jgi:hypothetical protein
MNMLELTKQELDKHSALIPSLNHHTQQVVNAIPFTTVDPRMKAVIATTQITAFASQFRRNILIWDGTEVPINAISFVVTGSGGGKDSSVNAARKCFSKGYEQILETRKSKEIQNAIRKAQAAGEDPTSSTAPEIYEKYLKPLPPIDIMPTTGPGLVQHINDIGDLDLTTGFMYAGEFSDELAYNADMTENIKILSELYDIGNKEMKYTKGVEHRSKAIQGQAISALFVGSPGHILYDESTKKKFNIAFMSKLARRSWFCYTPEKIPEPTFNSLDEMLDYEEDIEVKALKARDTMASTVKAITNFGLSTAGQTIGITEEVFRLFKTYKRYNSDLADTYLNQDSTTTLIRRHLQWKALKLAGAFAIFDLSNEIQTHHYVEAIRFCELLDKDMEQFEYDLNKASHERFSDYIRIQVQSDGKAIINVHDLKKNNFIMTVSKTKLQELVNLASGYDTSGIYSIINDGGAIQYEPIIKTEIVGISYKPINTTELNTAVESNDIDAIRSAKHDISITTAYGYELADTTFEDLGELLQGDFAYSPFKFKNGVRGRDNILGGTKWLVLDIDDSPITADEAHFMLSDINHHIALSSNPDNYNKFRVLIELDTNVELSAIAWKHFYLAIANDLALKVDPLPQSQIFFSYANRPIWSNLDAQPLEARPYIILAKEQETNKEYKDKQLTNPQKKALLADKLTTFEYAFDAPWGSASRNVIRAMYHLKDLDGTVGDAIELYNDIQEYWETPFNEQRSRAMVEQIKRLFQ